MPRAARYSITRRWVTVPGLLTAVTVSGPNPDTYNSNLVPTIWPKNTANGLPLSTSRASNAPLGGREGGIRSPSFQLLTPQLSTDTPTFCIKRESPCSTPFRRSYRLFTGSRRASWGRRLASVPGATLGCCVRPFEGPEPAPRASASSNRSLDGTPGLPTVPGQGVTATPARETALLPLWTSEPVHPDLEPKAVSE
jgi:hypothetical protein